MYQRHIFSYANNYCSYSLPRVATSTTESYDHVPWLTAENVINEYTLCIRPSASAACLILALNGISSSHACTGERCMARSELEICLPLVIGTRVRDWAFRWQPGCRAYGRTEVDGSEKNGNGETWWKKHRRIDPLKAAAATEEEQREKLNKPMSIIASGIRGFSPSISTLFGLHLASANARANVLNGGFVTVGYQILTFQSLPINSEIRIHRKKISAVSLCKMGTNSNSGIATTRFPSHQLSSGLYVSGRPEQYKEKLPTMSSTAVPYTGGDIKKSGELGKMFDIPVENPNKMKKSGPVTSTFQKSLSYGASNSGPLSAGGAPRSAFSTSGPLNSSGFSRQNTTVGNVGNTQGSKSGPLSGNLTRQVSQSGSLNRSGDLTVGPNPKTAACSGNVKNSGPLSSGVTPPIVRTNSGNLLPATGLITSGPISSGPLSSSGALKKSTSGPLDSTGVPVKLSSINHNQAVSNLSKAEEYSFQKGFPKVILWTVIPLFIVGFIAGGFIVATVHNAILLIVVASLFSGVCLLLTWNTCWGRRSLLDFLASYRDADLRNAKDGQYVKVTGAFGTTAHSETKAAVLYALRGCSVMQLTFSVTRSRLLTTFMYQRHIFSYANNYCSYSLPRVATSTTESYDHVPWLTAENVINEYTLCIRPSASAACLILALNGISSSHACTGERCMARSELEICLPLVIGTRVRDWAFRWQPGCRAYGRTEVDGSEKNGNGETWWKKHRRIDPLKAAAATEEEQREKLNKPMSIIASGIRGFSPSISTLFGLHLASANARANVLNGGFVTVGYQILTFQSLPINSEIRIHRKKISAVSLCKMGTNSNSGIATTRFPSHQLSSGLYVSGRPEQYKEKLPTMSSTAVPYTGGDIKKSGELGKMFDIPVENPNKMKKSGPVTSTFQKSLSYGASNSGPLSAGGAPRSAFSTSGPLNSSGFSRQNTTVGNVGNTQGSKSGPLSGNLTRQVSQSGSLNRSGDLTVGPNPKTAACSGNVKNSGPLSSGVTPPIVRTNSGNLLPATGLITSGPISSGPLSSSGALKKSTSGPLDSTGVPVKLSSINHNQAVSNLSKAEEYSFQKGFPKVILWTVIPLFIVGFIAGGFIVATVHNAILLIVVASLFSGVCLLLTWNTCWGRRSLLDFLASYRDADLRNAKDGQYVKVTGEHFFENEVPFPGLLKEICISLILSTKTSCTHHKGQQWDFFCKDVII
eukprot:Gb_14143 [translate_table: standard]